MAKRKRPARPPRAAPARRHAPPLQRSKPAIALGVLDARLGYFVRRLQVAIFQDFIARRSSRCWR